MRLSASVFPLLFLHNPPAEESVQIVEQKNDEADRHRNEGTVGSCRQHPQKNQNQVVCRVRCGEPGTTAEGEINGDEAGCYRQGRGNQILGPKIGKNEIKQYRYCRRQRNQPQDFSTGETVNLHLCPIAPIGVLQPCDEGKLASLITNLKSSGTTLLLA